MAVDLQRVQSGHNLGFIGAPIGEDITSPDGVRGWHEWDGAEWMYQEDAGVLTAGVLATAAEKRLLPEKRGAVALASALASEPQPKVARGKADKSVPLVPQFADSVAASSDVDDDWT